jgi:hypothetical protein
MGDSPVALKGHIDLVVSALTARFGNGAAYQRPAAVRKTED